MILIPITIISFFFRETNFIMKEKQHNVDKIKVRVDVEDNIIEVDINEYIIGVVAGEMPALFHPEAIKAQAIASRTYLINHLQYNDSISNTTNDQVYLTKEEMKEKWLDRYNEYYSKIKRAVLQTSDKIMYYHNKPIKAYYFSKSNGYTASSETVFKEQIDYLVSIESPFEGDDIHIIHMTKEEFCKKLEITCSSIKIDNIKKDNSNRIHTISINDRTLTGVEVRKKLSLRSTDFSINTNKDIVEITTNGYGHGVGMSQYGANYMAKKGYTYEEILKYYYKDINIDSI